MDVCCTLPYIARALLSSPQDLEVGYFSSIEALVVGLGGVKFSTILKDHLGGDFENRESVIVAIVGCRAFRIGISVYFPLFGSDGVAGSVQIS